METRQGSYIYAGEASTFHEWEFRTRLRMQNKRDPEKYAEAISKVVEGLRGDAFVVAETVGLDRLWRPPRPPPMVGPPDGAGEEKEKEKAKAER